jgi:hypothetical protein
MAKAPGMGPVKSRLHGALGTERATTLYRCFLLDRLDALSGLDGIDRVVAFTPPDAEALMASLVPPGFRLVAQRGADLGERLADLLAGLIATGHRGAIAIDSDSPTLPMAYVAEAAGTLGHGDADLVLGPCEDGGYYLVGVRDPAPELFDGIPWSTEHVLALTLERAEERGLRTHLLPRWFDVDTEADLRRLHAEIAATSDGPPRTRAFIRTLFAGGGVDGPLRRLPP